MNSIFMLLQSQFLVARFTVTSFEFTWLEEGIKDNMIGNNNIKILSPNLAK
jgi:hypothetical protein